MNRRDFLYTATATAASFMLPSCEKSDTRSDIPIDWERCDISLVGDQKELMRHWHERARVAMAILQPRLTQGRTELRTHDGVNSDELIFVNMGPSFMIISKDLTRDRGTMECYYTSDGAGRCDARITAVGDNMAFIEMLGVALLAVLKEQPEQRDLGNALMITYTALKSPPPVRIQIFDRAVEEKTDAVNITAREWIFGGRAANFPDRGFGVLMDMAQEGFDFEIGSIEKAYLASQKNLALTLEAAVQALLNIPPKQLPTRHTTPYRLSEEIINGAQ